jgi:hypothetical protein
VLPVPRNRFALLRCKYLASGRAAQDIYFVLLDSRVRGNDSGFRFPFQRFRGGIIEESGVGFHYFLRFPGMGPDSEAGKTVLLGG